MNGHPAYKAILDRMWELHDSKAKDYGSTGDPLANLRNGERFGMPAWKRCLVEADSAFYRLENYCNGRNPSSESAKNALMDTAAFALLALLFIEEGEEARHKAVADAQFEFETATLPKITSPNKTGHRPPSIEIGKRMTETLEKAK